MTSLRAPTLDDAAAVLAVLEARDRADLGAPDYTLNDLLEEWRTADVDLAADAIVAEDADGRIVGYALVRRHGTLAAVDPDREGEGVGARLLAWAERRDRERGSPRHRVWVAESNERGRALMEAAGYKRERSYRRLSRRLDAPAEPVELDGLRPVEPPADAVPLHELCERSFAGNADYEPKTFEAFRDELLDAHDFDAGLSRVLERDGRLLGFALARRWEGEDVGYVDLLAVDPDHRGRGLAGALLGAAFAAFQSAGLAEAQLGVAADNAAALRLYERAGMAVRFRVDAYVRER